MAFSTLKRSIIGGVLIASAASLTQHQDVHAVKLNTELGKGIGSLTQQHQFQPQHQVPLSALQAQLSLMQHPVPHQGQAQVQAPTQRQRQLTGLRLESSPAQIQFQNKLKQLHQTLLELEQQVEGVRSPRGYDNDKRVGLAQEFDPFKDCADQKEAEVCDFQDIGNYDDQVRCKKAMGNCKCAQDGPPWNIPICECKLSGMIDG